MTMRNKRTKMMKKIRQKVEAIKQESDSKFDGENDPSTFNEQANQQLKDIFRDTRYNQRRKQRLLNWRDKKYSKFKVNTFEKGARRLHEFD